MLAAPAPAAQQASEQLDQLNEKMDLMVEQYNQVKVDLDEAKKGVGLAQGKLVRVQSDLDAQRKQVDATAVAAYRSGTANSQLGVLVDSDGPQTFLDRAAALDQLAHSQTDQLRAAAVARRQLQETQNAAQRRVSEVQALSDELDRQRAEIEGQVAVQQQLLARVNARSTAVLAVEAKAAASKPISDVPASGRAKVAVDEAQKQLGKAYRWGAEGPANFDCSGLTLWVWGKAGVSLPRTAADQYNAGQHVSQSQLQPGDLVFFGRPISHVGIYIGAGQMISAPHTGDVVKVDNAFRSNYVGATRPS